MQTMTINDQVAVGPQPSDDKLQSLSQQGYKSVANFRSAPSVTS